MSSLTATAGFSKPNSASQRSRWQAFVAATVAAHLFVIVSYPNIVIPPPPWQQAAAYLAAAAVCCVPFFVGFVELLLYRTSTERVVSYLSLGVSSLWLLAAMDAGVTLWNGWNVQQYLSLVR